MRHLSILLILILSFLTSTSQVIVETTTHDLGDVKSSDEKYYDYRFTNASDQVISIDKIEDVYGVRYRLQNKEIQPDSSVLIRIKYTPKRKGDFSVDVPVTFSSNNQPIILTMRGKAISFDASESMEPPPFKQLEQTNTPLSNLLIEVVDKNSGLPISGANIDIIWDGVIYETLKANSKGLSGKSLEPDSYYLIANAAGYEAAETDFELDSDDKKVTIELGPVSGEIIVEKIEEEVPIDSGQALQNEVVVETKPIKEDTIQVYIADNDTTQVEKGDEKEKLNKEEKIKNTSKNLPEHLFTNNNIVFLIDISVSMRSQGKLELLKASMIELASQLRSSDKLAIVTYSSKTNVVLHSVSASNKDEIIKVIQSLEAGGRTSGAKGIKKAYKVLNENYIRGGNNQVFISTDGAFNLEKKDKKILRTVKKNTKKGSKISVLGIKNKMWTVKNMEEIARVGDGNYIHIENYETAKSSLINEIKKQSAIK